MPTAYVSRSGETASRSEHWLADTRNASPLQANEGKKLVEVAERIINRYYVDSLHRVVFMSHKASLANYNEGLRADLEEPMTVESLAARLLRFLATNLDPTVYAALDHERLLARYIEAAMALATYETLPGDGSIYGEIPGFQGVYANADTLEACRTELAEVLRDWLNLRLSWHRPVPVVNGIDLTQAAPL